MASHQHENNNLILLIKRLQRLIWEIEKMQRNRVKSVKISVASVRGANMKYMKSQMLLIGVHVYKWALV